MSHFTVLVVGDDPEDQLAPFDENLRTEYKDKSEEYKKEYLTESTKEFYCESSSSWGQRITRELYNKLRTSKAGRVIIYTVTKIDPMSYFKKGGTYKGYFTNDDGTRCKGSQWFEVDEVLETTHPNPETCFEGTISIRKIRAPKEIALKDKYPIYEDYLRDWHGTTDLERQGYDFNPKAKWDWYQLGGRWAGFFTLKPDGYGQRGQRSWTNENVAIKPHTVDQARKGDIDFEAMVQENFEEASETYDEFEEKHKSGELRPGDGYFHYGIENTGDRDNYIPETREQYVGRLTRVSTFAVLYNGEWYEKGEMGWWGCVSDEKDPKDWAAEFDKLLDSLPDDTLLSVYDCHI